MSSKSITLFKIALGISLVAFAVSCGRAPAKTANPDPNTVIVKDFEFSPATLTVPVGTTVTWQFAGPTPHSSTADAASTEKWDSGVLASGKTYTHRFNTAGSFPYHCDPHPYMKGTIVVR